MKKTLSVVLATFNEEKNLASCLDSVKDIADEIVIVDGTSTDKTVEIAKKYKAKIKITTNKPNFHINKQMAIDMATKDWILQLDGDERISPELKDEIKKILSHQQSAISNQTNGYWMPRKNLFLGRFLMKGGQYPDYTLRFYRKGKGRLPQKDVHEQAVVEGKVGYLKSALLHYPYENFSQYLKKWNRYNDLFAKQIEEEQKTKNIFQKLFYAFGYLVAKPGHWLLTTFIRHKGFMDGWQGFVFSFFSALRFPVSYIKYIGLYKFLFIAILLIASVIRFWDFPLRWGIGGDDARDAMIALESLKRLQLPLMGPFSSAGPFVFGGIYYWFIMLSYVVFPYLMSAPWVMMEILSISTVGLFMYLGKELVGRKFSIILGLLAAFSPQLVVRALSLGPHTFVVTLTVLACIFYLLLWKTKKQKHSFFLGVSIGLALSMHYQAINLLIFFPALFFISALSFKERIKSFVFSIVGFLIPSLPLLYWDANQGFSNIRNILDYFLIGQYRIYVPNSWKLFLFRDFPSYWSFVAGKFPVFGLVLFVTSILTFLYLLLRKKIIKPFVSLGVIFLILIFVNRFYRGERSEGYLLYFLPFILLFTSLFIYSIHSLRNKTHKLIAVFILLVIIISNMIYIIPTLKYRSGLSIFKEASKFLSSKYPGEKFALYDYEYKFYNWSMPLAFVMSFDKNYDRNGKKIALSCDGKGCPVGFPVIDRKNLLIIDIAGVKKEDFDKNKKKWIYVSQESAYDDLIGWLNKNQLKSTFSLKDYIINRVNNL